MNVDDILQHWRLTMREADKYRPYLGPLVLSPAMCAELEWVYGQCICSTCGKASHFGPCYDIQKWMQDEIKPLGNWKYLVFGGEG